MPICTYPAHVLSLAGARRPSLLLNGVEGRSPKLVFVHAALIAEELPSYRLGCVGSQQKSSSGTPTTRRRRTRTAPRWVPRRDTLFCKTSILLLRFKCAPWSLRLTLGVWFAGTRAVEWSRRRPQADSSHFPFHAACQSSPSATSPRKMDNVARLINNQQTVENTRAEKANEDLLPTPPRRPTDRPPGCPPRKCTELPI